MAGCAFVACFKSALSCCTSLQGLQHASLRSSDEAVKFLVLQHVSLRFCAFQYWVLRYRTERGVLRLIEARKVETKLSSVKRCGKTKDVVLQTQRKGNNGSGATADLPETFFSVKGRGVKGRMQSCVLLNLLGTCCKGLSKMWRKRWQSCWRCDTGC